MKKEYDFSNAVRGKFYRPAKDLRIPIYLDPDIDRRLRSRTRKSRTADVSDVVNQILRKELEVLDSLS